MYDVQVVVELLLPLKMTVLTVHSSVETKYTNELSAWREWQKEYANQVKVTTMSKSSDRKYFNRSLLFSLAYPIRIVSCFWVCRSWDKGVTNDQHKLCFKYHDHSHTYISWKNWSFLDFSFLETYFLHFPNNIMVGVLPLIPWKTRILGFQTYASFILNLLYHA